MSAAAKEDERLQEEVERIRRKALANDPKNGQISSGTVIGDRIVLKDGEKPVLDNDGLAFDPNATVSFIVEEEPTALDKERVDQFAQEQQPAEELQAEFRRQLEDTRELSIGRGFGDPYKELLER